MWCTQSIGFSEYARPCHRWMPIAKSTVSLAAHGVPAFAHDAMANGVGLVNVVAKSRRANGLVTKLTATCSAKYRPGPKCRATHRSTRPHRPMQAHTNARLSRNLHDGACSAVSGERAQAQR